MTNLNYNIYGVDSLPVSNIDPGGVYYIKVTSTTFTINIRNTANDAWLTSDIQSIYDKVTQIQYEDENDTTWSIWNPLSVWGAIKKFFSSILSTDPNLGTDDGLVSSQKAIKTYIDNHLGDANVQSDWLKAVNTDDAYILNKPTKLSEFSNDSAFTTKTYVDNEINYVIGLIPDCDCFTTGLHDKLDGIETGAQKNPTIDWNLPSGRSGAVENKPNIPTDTADLSDANNLFGLVHIQSDFEESNSSSASYIKNKPSIYTQTQVNALVNGKENNLGNPNTNGMVLSSTSYGVRSWTTFSSGVTTYNALSDASFVDLPTINTPLSVALGTKVDKDGTKVLSDNNYTTPEKSKLSGVAIGAEVNVVTNLSLGIRTATVIPVLNDNGTGITIPNATTTLAGLLEKNDKVKLDGVATGAEVNVATNLVIGTSTATTMLVTNSNGTGITLLSASTTLAGLFTATNYKSLVLFERSKSFNNAGNVSGDFFIDKNNFYGHQNLVLIGALSIKFQDWVDGDSMVVNLLITGLFGVIWGTAVELPNSDFYDGTKDNLYTIEFYKTGGVVTAYYSNKLTT